MEERAEARRLLWLYTMGVVNVGTLTTLLVSLLVGAVSRARVEALDAITQEFSLPLPNDLSLPSSSLERITEEAVQERVIDLPRVEPMSPQELSQMGDAYLDAADAVPDEALQDDDWLERMNAELATQVEEEYKRLQRELGLLDEEEDSLPQEPSEAELDRQWEEDFARWEAEEDEIDFDDIEQVEEELESYRKRTAALEGQKARIEALEAVGDSDAVPDGASMVWETDSQPCPECAALAGTEVKSKRGHHPNCQCEAALVPWKPAAKGVPGFDGLTLEQLQRQLDVMAPLPDTEWKTKQTKRVVTRMEELRA